MATIQPQKATKEPEIRHELGMLLLRGGHIFDERSSQVSELLAKCDELQKAEPAVASLLKAGVFQLLGDISAVEYWARNAKALGMKNESSHMLLVAYANLGFASKAAEIFADVATVDKGMTNPCIFIGTSTGAFSAMCDASAALERAGGTVERKDLVMQAAEVVEALERLAVPEASMRAVMDQAGKILRDRKLMWLNDNPDISVSRLGESPFVAFNYRIAVSPSEAAEMTWELAMKLDELDLLPNRVTVGFIGEGEQKRGNDDLNVPRPSSLRRIS